MDPAPEVRRRACDLAGRLPMTALQMTVLVGELTQVLTDDDPGVAESACYALGELGEAAEGVPSSEPATPEPATPGLAARGSSLPAATVIALGTTATAHTEPLCREAAVSALGSLGYPAGLPAILAATEDKPAIRRRAVLALAGFDGDEVDAALARAMRDPDWQVRQAAEDLLGQRPRPKQRRR
jgi:HEAT repeat protein